MMKLEGIAKWAPCMALVAIFSLAGGCGELPPDDSPDVVDEVLDEESSALRATNFSCTGDYCTCNPGEPTTSPETCSGMEKNCQTGSMQCCRFRREGRTTVAYCEDGYNAMADFCTCLR